MINKLPRVAVCLAAYNGILWLPAQIETILEQVSVDVTLFVSVDVSSDGTFEYIESVAQKNPKIIPLPYGKRFGGAAQNFFRLLSDVDFLEYEYVALSDQDDLWRTDKLRRAVDVLSEGGADGYSSNVTAFWEDGRRIEINKAQPQKRWDFLFESAGPGCTFVMRSRLVGCVKSCVARHPVETGQIGLHDWFIYALARVHGFKWTIDNYSSLLYRQHANNQVGVNWGLRAGLYRVRKVLSGWGLRQSYLIARLSGLS